MIPITFYIVYFLLLEAKASQVFCRVKYFFNGRNVNELTVTAHEILLCTARTLNAWCLCIGVDDRHAFVPCEFMEATAKPTIEAPDGKDRWTHRLRVIDRTERAQPVDVAPVPVEAIISQDWMYQGSMIKRGTRLVALFPIQATGYSEVALTPETDGNKYKRVQHLIVPSIYLELRASESTSNAFFQHARFSPTVRMPRQKAPVRITLKGTFKPNPFLDLPVRLLAFKSNTCGILLGIDECWARVMIEGKTGYVPSASIVTDHDAVMHFNSALPRETFYGLGLPRIHLRAHAYPYDQAVKERLYWCVEECIRDLHWTIVQDFSNGQSIAVSDGYFYGKQVKAQAENIIFEHDWRMLERLLALGKAPQPAYFTLGEHQLVVLHWDGFTRDARCWDECHGKFVSCSYHKMASLGKQSKKVVISAALCELQNFMSENYPTDNRASNGRAQPIVKFLGRGASGVVTLQASPKKGSKQYRARYVVCKQFWIRGEGDYRRALTEATVLHRIGGHHGKVCKHFPRLVGLSIDTVRQVRSPGTLSKQGSLHTVSIYTEAIGADAPSKQPQSLFEYIKALKEPMPEDRIKHLVDQILTALHYLHQELRVVHGDLKPGNILVKASTFEVILIDFATTLNIMPDQGDNKGEGEGPSSSTQCRTTVWYAPLNILDGEVCVIDARLDIWSLGVVILDMLSGQPFYKHCFGTPTRKCPLAFNWGTKQVAHNPNAKEAASLIRKHGPLLEEKSVKELQIKWRNSQTPMDVSKELRDFLSFCFGSNGSIEKLRQTKFINNGHSRSTF